MSEWVTVPAKAWQKALELLQEVMDWHSDSTSDAYNECDDNLCMWCEWARDVIAAAPRPDDELEALLKEKGMGYFTDDAGHDWPLLKGTSHE